MARSRKPRTTNRYGRSCNIYRLQDVFLYTNAFDEGRKVNLSKAKQALRDACVSVPRSVRSVADLQALATKVGNAHGFDAYRGVYKGGGKK